MLNVNGPLALRLRSSAPLSSRTTVPESPEMVPPTDWVGAPVFVPTPTQLSPCGVPKAITPGAPPIKLVSLAVMRTTPFWENVSVGPDTASVSWVPAARASDWYAAPSWVQLPSIRLNSISSGLP